MSPSRKDTKEEQMLTLAIPSQKGGVGKTTTTVNLGATLALNGQRTLIVDLEPQAQAGSALGVNLTPDQGEHSLGWLMQAALQGIGKPDVLPHVQDVSAMLDPFDGAGTLGVLASLEHTMTRAQELFVTSDKQHMGLLRDLLASAASEYDICLIDTPPAVSSLNLVGLKAADAVVTLCNPEYATVKGALVLRAAVQRLSEASDDHRPVFLGAFLNRANPPASEAIEDLHVQDMMLKGGLLPFKSRVRKNRLISRAYADGVPAAVSNAGGVGRVYAALANELLTRLRTPRDQWDLPAPRVEDDQEAAVTANA
jgi:chromosome partitioning protein